MENKTFKLQGGLIIAFVLFCLIAAIPVRAQRDDYTAVYRLYNPQTQRHLYTRECREKTILSQSGFNYEGVAFYVATRQIAGSIPFYRLLLANGGHLYTADDNEVRVLTADYGNKVESVIGYVYSSPRRNSVPLYRMLGNGRHFFTTNDQEKNNFLQNSYGNLEGIAGYVWTRGANPCETDQDNSDQMPTGNFPVIYSQENYRGQAMSIERDWAGNRDWEGVSQRIRSIMVPPGWRLTLYPQRNFRGTPTVITESVSWGQGFWSGRTRSIRVERTRQDQPFPPRGSINSPIIYAGTNFDGPALVLDRDRGQLSGWYGSPHIIRSIRVPAGWNLVLYTRENFRGRSYNLSNNITFDPGDEWYNTIRSIKVYRNNQPWQR